MKVWNRLVCRIRGHRWMDYNISGPLFYSANWLCTRCLETQDHGTIGNTDPEKNKIAAEHFQKLFSKSRHIGSNTFLVKRER